MQVYVCLNSYDYEGYDLAAVYSTLRKARRHKFDGDGGVVMKVLIDDGTQGVYIPPPKRRKKRGKAKGKGR